MDSFLQEQAIAEILNQGWIEHVDWQESVDSTNAVARRYCQEDPAELPALFVADLQTAGKGRSQNSWWSPTGCLMFTLALPNSSLRPESNEWSQLALVAGVALVHLAQEFLPNSDPRLKWPNDLYLSDKKCAGILIESAANSSWLIGIGLNVTVDFADAPPEIQDRATSFQSQAGLENLALPTVLASLMTHLHRTINHWSSGQDDWQSTWQEHCLLTGKQVLVRLPGSEPILGVCESIDASGCLLLRTLEGVTKISSGEILEWH